jgi:hypothetical protein
MKKQKQKNIAVSQFVDIVTNHKMKEVSPPDTKGDLLTGKTAMTAKEATASWFKTAKQQNPSSGFLEVPSEGLKPQAAFDREMLYKGKKK